MTPPAGGAAPAGAPTPDGAPAGLPAAPPYVAPPVGWVYYPPPGTTPGQPVLPPQPGQPVPPGWVYYPPPGWPPAGQVPAAGTAAPTGQGQTPTGQTGQTQPTGAPIKPAAAKPDTRADGRPDAAGLMDRRARRERLEQELRNLTPEQRDSLVKLNRMVLYFGGLMLLAMLGLFMPLPWPALGMVALAAAVVMGVVGIVRAQKVPMGRGAVMYLALGLGLAATLAFYAMGLLVTWGPQWDYQQCLSDAQTVQGRDACVSTLQNQTANLWNRLIGR